ncbi:MAG: DUF4430 domain-containing protein, partial [Thermoleophilaceae bacterium]
VRGPRARRTARGARAAVRREVRGRRAPRPGRGARAAILLCASVLAGCGLGAGEEREGGAQLRVTRDFGRTVLGSAGLDTLREDHTVMRFLRSEFDVETRFGGRFVQSIDGLEGGGPIAVRDWFFWVNGVESSVGAAEYELSPGDRVQWDHRDWRAAMRVPAIVGAFPEPFLSGVEGERRPVRVECGEVDSGPCRDAKRALERVGVPVSGSSLGAPGTETVVRLVVARWPRARIVRGGPTLEDGPDESGVFARFAPDGRSLELLDENGDVARTVRPGAGTALVAALQPRADELLWLVTALDQKGIAAGVRALRGDALRDAFAVAVTGRRVEKLPLEDG